MHQNALIYRVTLSLTLAPLVLFLSVGTDACPGVTQRPRFWVQWPLEHLRRQASRHLGRKVVGLGRAWNRAVGAPTSFDETSVASNQLNMSLL